MFKANLAGFCHGNTIGWSGPALWILLSEDSPLPSGPITINDSGWIGSVTFLGLILGICLNALSFKFCSGKFTRCWLAVPVLVSFYFVKYYGACNVYV